MPDRSSQLTDAAIRVLVRGGSRALTHRAVDAEAELPSGSTSNIFRSRRALVAAVVDAVLQRDLQRLEGLGADGHRTPGELAAAFVTRTLQEARRDVLARAALLVDPDGEELRHARERLLLAGGDTPVAGIDPATRRLVVVVVDGLLLDSALWGAHHDAGTIAASIDAVVAASARG